MRVLEPMGDFFVPENSSVQGDDNPLCASPAPMGGRGRTVMRLHYPYTKFFKDCVLVLGQSRHRGDVLAAGPEPPEHDDFNQMTFIAPVFLTLGDHRVVLSRNNFTKQSRK